MPTVTDESETSVPKDVMGILTACQRRPSHSSTLSTSATPKKISQRVASAFSYVSAIFIHTPESS